MPNIDLVQVVFIIIRVILLAAIIGCVMAVWVNVGTGNAALLGFKGISYGSNPTSDMSPVACMSWAVSYPFNHDFDGVPAMMVRVTTALVALLVASAAYSWALRIFF